MRITYIAHSRFPTEKANGFQVANVCKAFIKLGHTVTLVAPTIQNSIKEDAHEYYHVSSSLEVQYLDQFDALHSPLVPGFLAFSISMSSYGKKLKEYFGNHQSDVLYVRSPLLLESLLTTGISVILELHTLPRRNRSQFVRECNKCTKVIALTSLMKKELVEWGVNTSIVMVEGDAVDLSLFQEMPSSSAAKTKWKLPEDRPVLGYVGSLVTQDTIEKGIPELLRAFAILRDQKVPFYGWIVGGPMDWVERYRHLLTALKLTDYVRMEGPISFTDIPSALAACDVCVYPAPASSHPYFLRDTSPLKLFEYMAAARPIVSANLPPLRDILDDSMAEFSVPGDSASLANALQKTLFDSKEAHNKAEAAHTFVQNHTWEKRMARIISSSILSL